jgi:hypothetical protein
VDFDSAVWVGALALTSGFAALNCGGAVSGGVLAAARLAASLTEAAVPAGTGGNCFVGVAGACLIGGGAGCFVVVGGGSGAGLGAGGFASGGFLTSLTAGGFDSAGFRASLTAGGSV